MKPLKNGNVPFRPVLRCWLNSANPEQMWPFRITHAVYHLILRTTSAEMGSPSMVLYVPGTS